MYNILTSYLVTSLLALFMGYTSLLQATTIQSRTELPLAVVVCSYNNAPWVEKNLDSIFMQDYTNFRVIYVDDASQDGTADLVAKYRTKHHLEDKITLIANKKRCRKTKNVYNTFHSCDDNEIIVICDGDDWLKHNKVFLQINREYLYKDIWLTWGQFEMSEQLTKGWAQAVPQDLVNTNDFREFTWVYGAPRTFYAWLFKQIKLEDFIGLTVNGFEGKFYPSSDDFAMMYPMLEMARDHLSFIPEPAYIVNQYNPLSTSHAKPADPIVSLQTACEVKMYKRRYQPLEAPITHVVEELKTSKADVIIVSSSQEQTASMLTTLENRVTNIGSILVLCQHGIAKNEQLAQKAHIRYVLLPQETNALMEAISQLPHKHVLLLDDTVHIIESLDCQTGIIDLERTGALGCYYHVSPAVLQHYNISCEHVRDELYAWKIYRDFNHVIEEHGCNMSLYRKDDIVQLVASKESTMVTDLKESLPKRSTNMHALGLCYAHACAKAPLCEPNIMSIKSLNYYVEDFDKAMYATDHHKKIYHEIIASKKEAAFVDVLRKNYNAFFNKLPFSVVPKIPKIIHHIWLGGPMPEQYVVWRKKWQDMHPEWVCMLWTDKEVAHLSLENQVYYDETTSFGEKANLLRYELLYQFGGLYVDTDCECFKPFDLLHHCCDFYAGCEYPQRAWSGDSSIMIGNSIMASRPGHPLVAKFIKGIEHTWHEKLQVARSGTRYATDIIKNTLPKLHDVVMIFPANIFYPWASLIDPWEEPASGQEHFVQPETWSLHYWHFTWSKKTTNIITSEMTVKKESMDQRREPRTKNNQGKKRILRKRTQG